MRECQIPKKSEKLRGKWGTATKPPEASRSNTSAQGTHRAPTRMRGGQAKSDCGKLRKLRKIAENCKQLRTPPPPPRQTARPSAKDHRQRPHLPRPPPPSGYCLVTPGGGGSLGLGQVSATHPSIHPPTHPTLPPPPPGGGSMPSTHSHIQALDREAPVGTTNSTNLNSHAGHGTLIPKKMKICGTTEEN